MAVNEQLAKIGIEQTRIKVDEVSNILLRGNVDIQEVLRVLEEVKIKLAVTESAIRGDLTSFTEIKDKK